MRKKMIIDTKYNTLNFNLKILQENIMKHSQREIIYRGEDVDVYEPYIDEGYAEYLVNQIELLKDKKKRYSGVINQKGKKIKDVFNDKEYISMREAERKTGLNIAEIKYSIDNNIGLQKSYKFEEIED